ncbi:MAG: 30S ribosomal protein S6 [Patescibacteria group bacterium]|nr:30S ribosomal protein S6 [Patescibacteria group bacterium]
MPAKNPFYELSYLISAELSEAAALELQEKIQKTLLLEAKVLRASNPQKKRLAYPIAKRREAYLASIEFEAQPETASDCQGQLKEIKEVLRFLMIKKKFFEEKKPGQTEKTAETREPEKTAEKPDEKPKKEKALKTKKEEKVDLEKIGQDLDKILDE